MSDGSVLCARHKSRMVCVDVRRLNIDEALRVIRGRSQPLPQQLRNNIDNSSMEAREPLQFLHATARPSVPAKSTFSSALDSPDLCNCGKS